MIDSRGFPRRPPPGRGATASARGPKSGPLTGGTDFNDHPPDLGAARQGPCQAPGHGSLHGGSPKGAELIASRWADHRKVAAGRLPARLDQARPLGPFKRNDAMLEVLPIGVLVFPGTGIQENLADKARKLGIPVLKHEGGA